MILWILGEDHHHKRVHAELTMCSQEPLMDTLHEHENQNVSWLRMLLINLQDRWRVPCVIFKLWPLANTIYTNMNRLRKAAGPTVF